MKKYLFMAIAALAMVACGNKTNADAETVEAPAVEESGLDIEAFETVLASSEGTVIADVLSQAQVEVAKLVSLGQNAEAYSLADAVLVSIAKNAENLEALNVDYTATAEALEAVKAASENAVAEEVVENTEGE